MRIAVKLFVTGERNSDKALIWLNKSHIEGKFVDEVTVFVIRLFIATIVIECPKNLTILNFNHAHLFLDYVII
jgi:hypothetical protein